MGLLLINICVLKNTFFFEHSNNRGLSGEKYFKINKLDGELYEFYFVGIASYFPVESVWLEDLFETRNLF